MVHTCATLFFHFSNVQPIVTSKMDQPSCGTGPWDMVKVAQQVGSMGVRKCSLVEVTDYILAVL